MSDEKSYLIVNIRLTGEWVEGADELGKLLSEYVGCELSRPQVFMMGLALLRRSLERQKGKGLFEGQTDEADLEELGKAAKYQAGK